MIKDQIIADLRKALQKLDLEQVEPSLEHPAQETHGDYATNVAMVIFGRQKTEDGRQKWGAPVELAKAIVDAYPKVGYLTKIEVAEPGFINFWLRENFLSKELGEVLKEGDDYGKAPSSKPQATIMVEFAHPNTHKPFHIGHLRNISLGESIVRLLGSQGTKVIRANYQGDVGLHIAKCLWVLKTKNLKLKTLDEKIKLLGDAYATGAKAYDSDPKARLEIEKLNRQIYQKDPQVFDLWKETRAWSLEYFERIYKRVDSHFDRYYFEGEVAEPGKEIVLKGLAKGVFEKSEGAIIFPGKKYGLHNRVFINQVGLPTYEAKDMGLGNLQFFEFKPDLIIHVVGPEQKGYFEVVFKALVQLLPETAGKEYHLIYGWVRLKTGKMSSRTGEVVLAEWLLDEVKARLKKTFKMTEEVAEMVAVGAVKYSLLKFSPRQEIAFDIDESINLEGDSGPYLQYTHARCMSVLKKAGEAEPSTFQPATQSSLARSHGHNTQSSSQGGVRVALEKGDAHLLNVEELAILRTLYKFPEVVADAAQAYSPNLICNFLFDLGQKYNLFYNKLPIIKAETAETREQRLGLTAATAQIIKNGLYLLGIQAPEKM